MQKNLEASQESLGILKKMRRAQVWGGVFQFLKWGVIIGVSLGAYVFLEPYIQSVLSAYDSLNSSLNDIQNTTQNINKMIPATTTPVDGAFLDRLQGIFRSL